MLNKCLYYIIFSFLAQLEKVRKNSVITFLFQLFITLSCLFKILLQLYLFCIFNTYFSCILIYKINDSRFRKVNCLSIRIKAINSQLQPVRFVVLDLEINLQSIFIRPLLEFFALTYANPWRWGTNFVDLISLNLEFYSPY